MMGVDYDLTDETKNKRISDYFASIWSESNQSALDSATSNFGTGGFTQGIYRGDADASAAIEESKVGDQKGSGSIVAKKAANSPENQLGGASILGE